MLKEKNKHIRMLWLCGDLILTMTAFWAAYVARDLLNIPNNSIGMTNLSSFTVQFFLLYVILPLWAILLYYNRSYLSIRRKRLAEIQWPIVKTIIMGGPMLMAVLFILNTRAISRLLILLFLLFSAVLLMAQRACIYFFSHYICRKGYNYRTILIAGTGKRAKKFAGIIQQHKEWGLKIIGFIDRDPSLLNKQIAGERIIGTIDNLEDILTGVQVDEVVFVVPRKWLDMIERAVLLCEKIGIKTSIAVDLYQHTIASTGIKNVNGWPLLSFNPVPLMEGDLIFKRMVDIVLSMTALILTAPLFPMIVLAIKLTSDGPVFFRQERVGLNGRRFNLLKFRTMVIKADELKEELEHLNEMTGPVFKIENDPRLTSVGRFLRKYSLDELPQFINILKGDMSIVGPRPPIPLEVDKYDMWQRRRLSMKPGITCLWQVNGRNKIDFSEWVRLDLEYIDKWSHTLDVKILIKTIPAVLKGTGV